MTIQESVLAILERERGAFCSGERISRELNVSRAAIWKATDALRKSGCPIEAVTRRGYRLAASADHVSASGVKQYLDANAAHCRIETFPTLTSTNALLRERATLGAPAGSVVIAEQQTAGRGRRGQTFFSPPDTGVYMSVLLRPRITAAHAVRITTLAALAMCEAIRDLTGRDARIKWVNDVLLDERKVCGILTEASFDMETGAVDYAVLGVGVNLYAPTGGYPDEIAGIAGHVCLTRTDDARNRICGMFLNRFFARFATLEDRAHADAYRALCAVIGKRVWVIGQKTRRSATVLDVDEQCRLIVRYDDGREEALSSGEISVQPMQGARQDG